MQGLLKEIDLRFQRMQCPWMLSQKTYVHGVGHEGLLLPIVFSVWPLPMLQDPSRTASSTGFAQVRAPGP